MGLGAAHHAALRLSRSQGVRVAFIAAGSAACHSIIADVHGACYTWGRNEKGQASAAARPPGHPPRPAA
jgi:alpha-tubulin suppressor-like RCC1 family protein